MDVNWYYCVCGQEFGPVEFNELKRLVSDGLIASTDSVRCGSASWVMAKTVDRLDFKTPVSSDGSTGQTAVDSINMELRTAQARYSAAEQAATVQIAWALAPNIDPTWWAYKGGVGYGPARFSTIFEWVATGCLGPTDLVKNGVYGQFIPAGNVPGLFHAAATLANARVALAAAQEALKTQESVNGRFESHASNSTAVVEQRSTVIPALEQRQSQPATPTVSKTDSPAVSTSHVNRLPTVQPTVQPTVPPIESKTSDRMAPPSAPVAKPDLENKRVPNPVVSNGSTLSPKSTAATHPRPVTTVRPASPVAIASRSGPRTGRRLTTTVSIPEFLRSPKLLGGGMIALALAALLIMSSGSSARDIQRFQDLKQILEEIRTARANGATDFQVLKQKAAKLAQEYAAIYKNEASNSYPAKQALLCASRDDIPKMLSGDLRTESPFEKTLELRLKDAAATLGID